MNWLVIMAGGVGERFWPMSRRKRPKQLLPIIGDRTMIQETIDRLRPLFDDARIIVVTNREQAREVRRQLPRVKSVVAEPMGRNTAPCVGLAAAIVARRDPRGVMAVVPADSWIGDVKAYRRAVKESLAFAKKQDALITIGIQPDRPHTGYGYIQLGDTIDARFSKAGRFVEKPDLKTAEQYVAAGDYRWNMGMFVWSVPAVQRAFQRFQPALHAACWRIQQAVDTSAFPRVLAREYPTMEKISVDYAIMEKADNVIVANGDFQWDDVGDWAALERHLPADTNRNCARGAFVGLDARGCIAVSSDNHLIAALGVEDIVIVHTPDATLVCRKSDTQRIKQLVQQIAADKRGQRVL